MSINYRFNEWRVSGEQAESWSPLAYRLLSKNIQSDLINGYRIGQVLFLHHIKGLSTSEIRQIAGFGMYLNLIKGIIRGFKKDTSSESKEAYKIALYMVEHQPEVLERMYQVKVNKCS